MLWSHRREPAPVEENETHERQHGDAVEQDHGDDGDQLTQVPAPSDARRHRPNHLRRSLWETDTKHRTCEGLDQGLSVWHGGCFRQVFALSPPEQGNRIRLFHISLRDL